MNQQSANCAMRHPSFNEAFAIVAIGFGKFYVTNEPVIAELVAFIIYKLCNNL